MKDKQPEVQAKHHKKCVHCGRVFSAFGAYSHIKGRLNACMANHTKAAHPEFYKKWPKEEKKEVDGTADAPATKRSYTRKAQPQSSVCFCPKCGCNIRAVQVAMGL